MQQNDISPTAQVMMCGTDASPRPPLDSWIKQCFAASDCR